MEFAAEVQEDVNFGCNVAPTRFPSQIGASSTERLPTKSALGDQPNKKAAVRMRMLIVASSSYYFHGAGLNLDIHFT